VGQFQSSHHAPRDERSSRGAWWLLSSGWRL